MPTDKVTLGINILVVVMILAILTILLVQRKLNDEQKAVISTALFLVVMVLITYWGIY